MGTAHQRKKQPELVRRALLDEAARLAVEQGIAAVTVQAVSEAAGVSKGGFMHHFPHKQALIDTLLEEMLLALSEDLDARIASDPDPRGAFTRAYVDAMFEHNRDNDLNRIWVLSVLMLSEAALRKKWSDWFNTYLHRYQATDATAELTIVRMAADGIWLADLSGTDLPARDGLRDRLIAATRP